MDKKRISDLIDSIEKSIGKSEPKREPKREPREPLTGSYDRRSAILAPCEPRKPMAPPREPVAFENRCKRFGCRQAKVMYSKWCDAHSEEEGV